MRNISFDNPWLLLVFIPLVLLIVIPYVIAIKRGNRSSAPRISLCLHLIIALFATLALAGMSTTTVMTETEVYVVADVSYSSSRNTDVIDGYIAEVAARLPKNSKMGVVCFAKDQVVLTELGEGVRSVKEAGVDESATDISGALDFTASLFNDDVIKKIVLITDGKETDNDGAESLINSIEALYAENISIDAIYVDNNLAEDTKEIQVSGVEFTESTYLGRETTANVLVESSYDTEAIIELLCGGVTVSAKAVNLTRGYNIVNFPLPTSTEGSYDYSVTVKAEGDESLINNDYAFTQSVTGKVKVLLVSSRSDDLDKLRAIYGDNAEITSYVNNPNVPSTVEEICKYDEIIISSVDIRGLNNVTSFVDAVQKAVFNFGKSLTTMGDLSLQNKTNDDLVTLEDMLPISYGNNDTEPKLYTLVLDSSRSMQMASRLIMTKAAAKKIIDLISPNDHIAIISFSGDVTVMQAPIEASNKNALIAMIDAIEPSQGTFIGKSLSVAHGLMKDLPYDNKQVMLISDGMSYSLELDDPLQMAKNLRQDGIRVSTINPMSSEGASVLSGIATSGGGKYYPIEDDEKIEEFVTDQIADDITETLINAFSPVRIDKPNDALMNGVATVPNVLGYVFAKSKPTSTTVLSVKYPDKDVHSPLYSYWQYGSGTVSCLTTSLSGEWAAAWTDGSSASVFLKNLSDSLTPAERVDYPYALDVRYDGINASVEVTPATLNPSATVDITVTYPDGSTVNKRLTFNSRSYFTEFATADIGKYTVEIRYAYGDEEYVSLTVINIPYSPEYDAFALFDSSSLFSAIRDRGTVTENAVPEITNDPSRIATYTVSFVLPFMIIAILLYIADIIVRKLKWRDIVTLINKIKSIGGKAV